MCVVKDGECVSSPAKEKLSEHQAFEEVQAPRSPWAKLLFRQVSKPKLPRKVTSSAKVNLNKYWSKFGELMASPTSSKNTLCDRLSRLSIQRTHHHSEAKKKLFFVDNGRLDPSNMKRSNEDSIIDDLLKEASSLNRFELLDDGTTEVDENLANEIREISYLRPSNIIF